MQPSDASTAATSPSKARRFGLRRKAKKQRDPEGRMTLLEHLAEFRSRLIISVVAVLLATVGAFFLTDFVFDLIREPVLAVAKERTGQTSINFGNVTGAFDIRLQIATTLGVVLASPVWLYEGWMFLMPAMKKRERWHALGFLGAAIPLFLLGCYTGYLILPHIVKLMASFAPAEDTTLFEARYYYNFVLRLCLVVGIAFIIPVVLVIFNFMGLISGKAIIKAWRWAIIGIATFAAAATPAADVGSMLLLMLPLSVLYIGAVSIALIHDHFAAKRRAQRAAEIEQQLASSSTSL